MDVPSSGRIDIDEAEYCFILSRDELSILSATLEQTDESVTVEFSEGRLVFKIATPPPTFQVCRTGDMEVEVRADAMELKALARKLRDVAMSDEEADYVAHVHLDQWFTEPPIGVSEVIIQRSDSFHP